MKMLPRLATLCILLLALSAYMNAGDVLNDFTFYLTGPSTSIETFHAEIYAWNGNLLGGNPLQGALGAPLFSTGPIVYTGTAALTPITINTGGLALANGAYVALFTVSQPQDYANSVGQIAFGDLLFQHVAGDGGGGFNFYNNENLYGNIGTTPWDDFADFGDLAWTAHFASGLTYDTTYAWDGSSTISAFGNPDTATYGQTFLVSGGATPEPGTMLLLGTGLLGLVGRMRKRLGLFAD